MKTTNRTKILRVLAKKPGTAQDVQSRLGLCYSTVYTWISSLLATKLITFIGDRRQGTRGAKAGIYATTPLGRKALK